MDGPQGRYLFTGGLHPEVPSLLVGMFGQDRQAVDRQLALAFDALSAIEAGPRVNLNEERYAALRERVMEIYFEMVGRGRPVLETLETALASRQAGMEERGVVLLAPDVAAQPVFAALASAQGILGRPLKIVAFARSGEQAREVRAGLVGTTLNDFEVIDIEGPPYDGNLGRAIVDQQVRFLDDGLAIQAVYSLDELEGLGRFLQMPDSSARAWAEAIRDQVLGRQL